MTQGGEIDKLRESDARPDTTALDPFALVTAETPDITATSAPALVTTVAVASPSGEETSASNNADDDFCGIVEIPHPLSPPEIELDEPPPAAEEPPAPLSRALPPTRGGGWTIPMLCAGAALIAMCVLLPLADQNHQLVYQREELKLDLAQIQKQVSVNDEFIKRVGDDPVLAERLAERQMRTIRQGASVLNLGGNRDSQAGDQGGSSANSDNGSMSPFMLVSVPPPPAMPPYKALGGVLTRFCGNPQRRLWTMGIGLFLMAAGLVMGAVPRIPWRVLKNEARGDGETEEEDDDET